MKIPDFTIMIPFTKIKKWFKDRKKPKFDPKKVVDEAIKKP